MDFNVKMDKGERKRYEDIKKSGSYLELDILIGPETELQDGSYGRMPVVSTNMYNCTREEISCLYSILKRLYEEYKEEFPSECTYAEEKLGMEKVGFIQTLSDLDTEE